MALKFGTYFSHHAGDPIKSGSLIASLVKHGRDLIEGVSGLGGRRSAGVKWQFPGVTAQPVRVVVRSNVSALSVVGRSQQPVVTLKNIFHGLFRRSHPETLASRYAQRISPLPYWSTFRSNEQFRSLGKRLATFSFVGMSYAVGSQRHQTISDEGLVVFDAVAKMFAAKPVCLKSSVTGGELWHAKLEDCEFGDLLTTSAECAVFDVKTKLNASPNDLNALIEAVEVISEANVELDQVSLPSDHSSLECELTVAVEMVSNQGKQLNEIIQTVCNQNCELSNWINQTVDSNKMSTSNQLLIDYADFDDCDSDHSLEVIDSWQENFSDVEVIDKEYISDSEEDDDDVLASLIAELEERAKKQQRELSEVGQVLSDQRKKIASIAASYATEIHKANRMAARVSWMTDRSVDYCNHVLMNELLPAVETPGSTLEKCKLPSHFNVAPVLGGFMTTVKDVKQVSSSHHAFPVIHSWQQDIAMCIVTKRYEFTLAEYLSSHSLTFRESTMLFLQLLEAVVHLNGNGICHGNLKSENIHVEMLSDGPHLLVANFGSSFRIGRKFGALSPKTEMWKCSHSYLMAPEISAAGGSTYWSSADLTKADLWTCGALGYELFGCANPFRQAHDGKTLTSSEYKESDLPNLPDSVPSCINDLVKLMLKRDPRKRPDPEFAANVLHICLWTPHEWQTSLSTSKYLEIRQWLIQFAAVTFCFRIARLHFRQECNLDGGHAIADTLKVLFLSRVSSSSVADAVRFACDRSNCSVD